MKTLFDLSVTTITAMGFCFIIWYTYPPNDARSAIVGDALPDVSGVRFEDIVNAHCDGAVGCEITMILNDNDIK